MHVRFVTDAQYVVQIVQKIKTHGVAWVNYRTMHADLIYKLHQLWDNERFFVVKIKSHQDLEKAANLKHLSLIIGNKCADLAATSSLQRIPTEIKELCDRQKHGLSVKRRGLLRYANTLLHLIVRVFPCLILRLYKIKILRN